MLSRAGERFANAAGGTALGRLLGRTCSCSAPDSSATVRGIHGSGKKVLGNASAIGERTTARKSVLTQLRPPKLDVGGLTRTPAYENSLRQQPDGSPADVERTLT